MLNTETSYSKRIYAVVTGASKGLGKEIAEQLLIEHNYSLILVARSDNLLKEVKSELEKKYAKKNTAGTKNSNSIVPDIKILPVDLAGTGMKSSVDSLLKLCSDLDVRVLINNAGFAVIEEFAENESNFETSYQQMLDLNVTATTALTHAFVREWKKERSVSSNLIKARKILFVSSLTGAYPCPGTASYAASKSYISSFASALTQELADFDISVTLFSAGAMFTSFADASQSEKALIWDFPAWFGGPRSAKEAAELSLFALMNNCAHITTAMIPFLYCYWFPHFLPHNLFLGLFGHIWRPTPDELVKWFPKFFGKGGKDN